MAPTERAEKWLATRDARRVRYRVRELTKRPRVAELTPKTRRLSIADMLAATGLKNVDEEGGAAAIVSYGGELYG